jgi:hypothetical protein
MKNGANNMQYDLIFVVVDLMYLLISKCLSLSNYRTHIDLANRPVNEVIKLDQVQVKYKPVMDHQFNVSIRL